jgi:two-component system KDP operon response regulator KdpE
VDVAEHTVTLAGEEITLTKKEFQLLALLIRHQGKIVTQKQIMTELWGITHEEDTHYLRILVKKLRTKIGDSALSPKYIYTIAGVGLRFLG